MPRGLPVALHSVFVDGPAARGVEFRFSVGQIIDAALPQQPSEAGAETARRFQERGFVDGAPSQMQRALRDDCGGCQRRGRVALHRTRRARRKERRGAAPRRVDAAESRFDAEVLDGRVVCRRVRRLLARLLRLQQRRLEADAPFLLVAKALAQLRRLALVALKSGLCVARARGGDGQFAPQRIQRLGELAHLGLLRLVELGGD
mmetsp:Transcript_30148/g.104176  ORF Transcript_30148/g.104176 Transcript_30148/m.104176 type:complete len:204 (-) Transcript_30148:188-799(-)